MGTESVLPKQPKQQLQRVTALLGSDKLLLTWRRAVWSRFDVKRAEEVDDRAKTPTTTAVGILGAQHPVAGGRRAAGTARIFSERLETERKRGEKALIRRLFPSFLSDRPYFLFFRVGFLPAGLTSRQNRRYSSKILGRERKKGGENLLVA